VKTVSDQVLAKVRRRLRETTGKIRPECSTLKMNQYPLLKIVVKIQAGYV
jgi:hypothetical protein